MAFEVIKNIVEAENETDSIKAKAAAEAQKIVSDARAKAETLIADMIRSAKSDEMAAVAEAVKKVQPEVGKIVADADIVCQEVRKTAEKNKEKVVDAVIRKVVGINGHS